MAEIKTSCTIPIPDECEEPLEELEIFFRTNKYKTESSDEVKLILARGEKGKGFWTSDLTVLPTKLELELFDGKVVARYTVDTSGQFITEDERGYWNREALAAVKFLETGQPTNLAEEERNRADQVRNDFARKGLWLGAIVAFFLFVAMIILLR